jgi:hypothetical protein
MAGPSTGTSEWTRMVGAIGPRYRLKNNSVSLDVKGALAAGWFLVQGHGFSTNTSSRSWALGVGAGARVSWERGALSPWLALDAIGWPGNHTIAVQNVVETLNIPALDLVLSLGASFRLW